MGCDLKGFEPIFGEAKPTCEGAPKLNPFLYRVFSPDPCHLTLHVSDFRSSTWESIRSIDQLEDLWKMKRKSPLLDLTREVIDMVHLACDKIIFYKIFPVCVQRDNIGIGGSWSDFVNYVAASLKSKDVKLVIDWRSTSNGPVSAKLVARKSKGMPLLSVSLSKLVDSAASEAMANMSLELFKAYSALQDLSVSGQDPRSRMTQMDSAENDKNLSSKRKFDATINTENQRFQNTSNNGNTAYPLNSETSLVTAAQNNAEKQPATEVQSSKVAQRVVPAFRRAKVRGVVLNDAIEEEDG